MSKGDMEDRITEVPGVAMARVEAVCCDGPNAVVFIGIQEKGGPLTTFHSAPTGSAALTGDLLETYERYLAAVRRAAAHGNAAQDLSAGHALTADPNARDLEQHFLLYAAAHLDELRDVLHNCPDPDQRAAAAAVIGYAVRKNEVIGDLVNALQDPDEAVRVNALRALDAIAVLAAKQPAAGLRISPTWMVELLHSVVLSDRVETVKTLLTLSDKNAQEVRDQIRERALPDLVEMARWKTPSYALPPFLLLGRVAGLTDQQAQQSWASGDREAVIAKAQPAPRKR
jgi:hypothetical protein